MQEEIARDAINERSQKMIREGRLEAGAMKNDRENEGMIVVGGGAGGKKNKKNKKKQQTAVVEPGYEDPFTHDIAIVQKFSMVGVSPPNLPQDLDGKIDEIEVKMKEFTEKGREQLEEEIVNREKFIEQEVKRMSDEAEEERKMAAEQSASNRRPAGNRGRGRGNRGGYGDRDGGGRGRGRGGRGRGNERDKGDDENMRTHDGMQEFEG